MGKRVKGLSDLRKALKETAQEGIAWEEIWFNSRTGEIDCIGEGQGENYFGSNWEMLEIDYNQYLGYTVREKIDYIKSIIAENYPEYAASLGY